MLLGVFNFKLFISLLVVFMFISCEKNENIELDEFDLFINELERLETSSVIIDEEQLLESEIYRAHAFLVDSLNNLILVDDTDWSVHYVSKKEGVISVSGGEGRGPGEYLLINQNGFLPDGGIFALDLRSRRVSKYSISVQGLELIYEINIPEYDEVRLQQLYYFDNKIFGVFTLTRPYEHFRELMLYELNKELEKVSLVTTLPSEELIERRFNDRSVYTENPFGVSTEWYFDQNTFYYGKTNLSRFKALDLETLDKDTVYISALPEHFATEEKIDFLNQRFARSFQQAPEYKQYLNELEKFQLYRRFLVNDNRIFVTLFNPSAEEGSLIVYDMESNDLNRINVPPIYRLFQVVDNRLFGIEYSDTEPNRIVILEIEE